MTRLLKIFFFLSLASGCPKSTELVLTSDAGVADAAPDSSADAALDSSADAASDSAIDVPDIPDGALDCPNGYRVTNRYGLTDFHSDFVPKLSLDASGGVTIVGLSQRLRLRQVQLFGAAATVNTEGEDVFNASMEAMQRPYWIFGDRVAYRPGGPSSTPIGISRIGSDEQVWGHPGPSTWQVRDAARVGEWLYVATGTIVTTGVEQFIRVMRTRIDGDLSTWEMVTPSSDMEIFAGFQILTTPAGELRWSALVNWDFPRSVIGGTLGENVEFFQVPQLMQETAYYRGLMSDADSRQFVYVAAGFDGIRVARETPGEFEPEWLILDETRWEDRRFLGGEWLPADTTPGIAMMDDGRVLVAYDLGGSGPTLSVHEASDTERNTSLDIGEFFDDGDVNGIEIATDGRRVALVAGHRTGPRAGTASLVELELCYDE